MSDHTSVHKKQEHDAEDIEDTTTKNGIILVEEGMTRQSDTTQPKLIKRNNSYKDCSSLSRRFLSTLPAAKPDGFWFKRDQPFATRVTIEEHRNAQLNLRRSVRLKQDFVSTLLSILCYLVLLAIIPVVVVFCWLLYQKNKGELATESANSTNTTDSESFSILK
jgi:hypothetical protein